MQIDKVAEENAVVGEGPIWNADQQALIWTDIHTGRLFSFDPGTERIGRFTAGLTWGGSCKMRPGATPVSYGTA